MIKIYKTDEKTIKVVKSAGDHNRVFYFPALFVASATGDKITITTEAKWLSNLTVNPVEVGEIYINDVQQTDVEACVSALNSFIGSFKSGGGSGGGGGVSPDDLAEAVDLHNISQTAHEQDASETIISGISVTAKRRGNKVYYLAQNIFKFKIDDSLNLNAVPYNRGQMRFEDSTGSIYFSSAELIMQPVDPDNPGPNNEKEVPQTSYYYGGAGTTYLNRVDMDKRPYEICVQTPLGNVFTIKMSYATQSDFFIVELTKIN
jgi:hypothetical protein